LLKVLAAIERRIADLDRILRTRRATLAARARAPSCIACRDGVLCELDTKQRMT